MCVCTAQYTVGKRFKGKTLCVGVELFSPDTCRWTPAPGSDPPGSRTMWQSTRQLKSEELELTVFYYGYCEIRSNFCGNIIFK